MSDTLQAMGLLNKVFTKYAGKDEPKDKLSREEMKDLLKNEFGSMLVGTDENAVNTIFDGLDRNTDQQVDFVEFCTMVVSISVALNEAI